MISNAFRKREKQSSLNRDFQVILHQTPSQDGNGKSAVDWQGHRARIESSFSKAIGAYQMESCVSAWTLRSFESVILFDLVTIDDSQSKKRKSFLIDDHLKATLLIVYWSQFMLR